ncbi:Permease of the drug/metabolite transporter (DMT) superfamily [Falsiroseomonas stagni DSM 19981]|uniref:Permease of the drug/metabolite transporter (DMT) superfamily n=1 Tax=Falsiroseomonas stagni DSM 19981 TaxID=1123062 RepID=A0A1I4DBV9_9PROT|nr:Permease of the drug/metabolite transporter (DMT) superfamily [Falsiroseomonas stagni DSM 19981]
MKGSPLADRTQGATAASAPPSRPRLPLTQDTIKGIAVVALGYGIISGADAAVKWALPEVGVAVAMIWRGVFGMIAIAILSRGQGLVPVRRPLLALRSILHCAVTVSFYLAWFRGFPLGGSYAVNAAAPLMMTVLAIPLLGEKVGWRRWTSTCVGFAGVMVILQPGGELWRWEAGMLLAAAALLALTRIWTRVLARTDTPQAIAFALLAAHVPTGFLLLPVFPPLGPLIPAWDVTLCLAFLGLANGCAHFLFARAFAIAPVSALAPYEYTTLLWGGILGFLLWAEVPALNTLVGALIVMAAGLYNLHREHVRKREAEATARDAAQGPRP